MSGDGGWLEAHRDAGAVTGVVGGVERPRHYGDPAGEYRAATAGAAVADRSFRVRLGVAGRAPAEMLKGVVTGRLPGPPAPGDGGLLRGDAHYNLVLTPKGRIVSDLRALPGGEGADGGLLLDVPAEGAEALREHLGRYLPPRFARVEDRSPDTGMLTVLGPGAADLVSRDVLGLRAESADLEALPDGGVLVAPGEPPIQVVRAGGFATPAWDVVADRGTVAALWARLVEAGAAPVGHGVLETLRVEAGRPRFGAELDDTILPPEAGLGEAFDHGKGCYTGQEVIVRIRDRGHVNRHLRGLELGEAAAPPAGAELYRPGEERPVGRVTTAVQSPRMGGAVALGYVRREVEPPAEVTVGGPDGTPARVRSLEGWGPA